MTFLGDAIPCKLQRVLKNAHFAPCFAAQAFKFATVGNRSKRELSFLDCERLENDVLEKFQNC